MSSIKCLALSVYFLACAVGSPCFSPWWVQGTPTSLQHSHILISFMVSRMIWILSMSHGNQIGFRRARLPFLRDAKMTQGPPQSLCRAAHEAVCFQSSKDKWSQVSLCLVFPLNHANAASQCE